MATMIRHGTANLYKSLDRADVFADLAELRAQCDVMGFQEVNSNGHREAVNALKQRGWGVYWPGGTPRGKPEGSNQVPIVWRKELFTVITTGKKRCFDGGMGSPSRWITWVVLRHKKSDDIVVRMNTHFIHQAWTSHPERQDAWNHHQEVMNDKARDMAARWGTCIGGGDMNRDQHDFANFEMVYPSEGTLGGQKYDYYFMAGDHRQHENEHVVHTNSDHDAFVVTFAAIPVKEAPADKQKPKPKPKPVDAATVKQPGVKPYERPDRYIRIPPPQNRWRYFAVSTAGDGDEDIIDLELPLSDVSITDNLSGYNSMSATIAPKYRRLLAPDGEPLFKEWTHAIFAENESGAIAGGGLLRTSTFEGPTWNIETLGYAGYAEGTPWVSNDANNWFGVEVDPFDVYRKIWDHIQGQPGSYIGLEIPDDVKAGYKIGVKLEQIEYDTQSGPLAFESGPVQLNWYTDHNLADRINDLATKTPFEWHERHFWDNGALRHVIDIGYPQMGVRQTALRFVVGENVDPVPSVESTSDDYATEVLVLGAGEGRAMIRGGASRKHGGLRRVAVVQDSSIKTTAAANSRARAELAWRGIESGDLTSLTVRNTKSAPNGSYSVGDEIYVTSKEGWQSLGLWVRITGITVTPAGNTAQLTVVRPDKIAQ